MAQTSTNSLLSPEELKAQLKIFMLGSDKQDVIYAHLLDMLLDAYLKGRSDEKEQTEIPESFQNFISSPELSSTISSLFNELNSFLPSSLKPINNSES